MFVTLLMSVASAQVAPSAGWCVDPVTPTIHSFTASCEATADGPVWELAVNVDWRSTAPARVVVLHEGRAIPLAIYAITEGTEQTQERWVNPAVDFGVSCSEPAVLEAVVTSADGVQARETLWRGTATGVENGGFENGMASWGMGGNAGAVTGEEHGLSPRDSTMLRIGWEDYASTVAGYAWQGFGPLPEGDYTLRWRDAAVSHSGYVDLESNTCDTASGPSFHAGVMTHDGEQFEELHTGSLLSLDTQELICDGDVEPITGSAVRRDWVERAVDFQVTDDSPLYAFFNARGSLYYQGHSSYVDDVRVTRESATPACGLVDRLGLNAVELFRVSEVASFEDDYDSFWHLGELLVEDMLHDLCLESGYQCEMLDGSVSRVNGLDAVLLVTDPDAATEYVLLIEVKSTRVSDSVNTGYSRENMDRLQRHTVQEGGSLAERVAFFNDRILRSNHQLAMCRGWNGSTPVSQGCQQLSPLWVSGVLSEICLGDHGDRLVATVIEEAWEEQRVCTVWGSYQQFDCDGEWQLVLHRGADGAWTPQTVADGPPRGAEDESWRWYCAEQGSTEFQTQPPDGDSPSLVVENPTLSGGRASTLAFGMLRQPEPLPRLDPNNSFYQYLEHGTPGTWQNYSAGDAICQ